jgi:hypothetical protein
MTGNIKVTAAIACALFIGGGAVELLHAQSKPPAFVVAEVDVKDRAGFEENFLKATRKDIADHGGKYVAGGYNKTISLVGAEPAIESLSFSSPTWTRSKPGRAKVRWTWKIPLAASMPNSASTLLKV